MSLNDVKSLVRAVARAFYDPPQIVLLDFLVRADVLKDDVLAARLGIQTKDLAKNAAILISQRIISVHRKSTLSDGGFRAVPRTFYYLDYKTFVDVAKWRIWKLRRTIQDKYRNEVDNQGFVCTRCARTYSMADITSITVDSSRGTFICDICQGDLVNSRDGDEATRSTRILNSLADQTLHIEKLLQLADQAVLPAFDIEQWIQANAPSDASATNQSISSQGVLVGVEIKSSDDSISQSQSSLSADHHANNAKPIPEWMAKSTISGNLTPQAPHANKQRQHSSHKKTSSSSFWGIDQDDDDLDDQEQDTGNSPVKQETITTSTNFTSTNTTTTTATSSNTTTTTSSTIQTHEKIIKENDNDDAEEWYRQQMEQQQQQQMQMQIQEEDEQDHNQRNDYNKRPRESPLQHDHSDTEETKRAKSSVFVKVQGKDVALDDVTDEMHDLMTPDEYAAYTEHLF